MYLSIHYAHKRKVDIFLSLLMSLTLWFWPSFCLVFHFDLHIKCFVLSLCSIIVSGRLQVTLDVANKQFIALEYKYHCGISTVHW